MTESLVGLLLMLVLAFLRMPIALAMGVVGIVGYAYMRDWSWTAAFATAQTKIYETGRNYTLSVVPLFILMGNFVTRAGHDSVDHHDGGGRNQDAERAARGDGAGRERVGIAELLHRWIGDLGERRGGGDRRAADGAEAGAADDGGHREPAAQVADERVRGAV